MPSFLILRQRVVVLMPSSCAVRARLPSLRASAWTIRCASLLWWAVGGGAGLASAARSGYICTHSRRTAFSSMVRWVAVRTSRSMKLLTWMMLPGQSRLSSSCSPPAVRTW